MQFVEQGKELVGIAHVEAHAVVFHHEDRLAPWNSRYRRTRG
jgi:hypothetical protein